MAVVVEMRLGVALSNIMESGECGHQDFIERAVKVHQFLIASSPQMIQSSGQDRTDIVSALEKTRELLNQQQKLMAMCILTGINPIKVAGAFGAQLTEEEHCMTNKLSGMQTMLEMTNAELSDPKTWTQDPQKQEKISQLYQGTVANCISQLDDLHRQLQPTTYWFDLRFLISRIF